MPLLNGPMMALKKPASFHGRSGTQNLEIWRSWGGTLAVAYPTISRSFRNASDKAFGKAHSLTTQLHRVI